MKKNNKYSNLIKTKNYRLQRVVSKFREISKSSVNNTLFIDGNNLFMRTFSSGINKFNNNGEHIGGIVGFLTSLKATMSIYKPKETYIFFDGKNNNQKKRTIFPEYKAGRNMKKWNTSAIEGVSLGKEDFFAELNRLMVYLYTLPVKVIKTDGFEADDCIAYVSQKVVTDKNIVIMSTDKDFLQLIDNRIKVYNSHSRKEYNNILVKDEFSIPPHNIVYWRMMDGDKSDNINGIKMFGLKTILKNFPFISEDKIENLEHFYQLVNKNCSENIIKKVNLNKDLIERNYKLMSLKEEDLIMTAGEKMDVVKSLENFWGDNCFYEFEFKKEALKDNLDGKLVGSIIAEFGSKLFYMMPKR